MKQPKLCHYLHHTQLNSSWQTNTTANFPPPPTVTESKCKIFAKRHPTFPQKCSDLGIKTENTLWTLQHWYFKVKRFYGDSKVIPWDICVTTKCGSPHSQKIYIELILISTSSLARSGHLIAHSYGSQEGGKELQILSKTFRGLQLTLFYSPRRSMYSTRASVFLHCSFPHILFLNNTFLSHEHILLFQYHPCQIYFLMQRKTTSKLSALPHTAYISLNAIVFAVFLTTFFLS